MLSRHHNQRKQLGIYIYSAGRLDFILAGKDQEQCPKPYSSNIIGPRLHVRPAWAILVNIA